jgi:hypothetical protein
MKGQSEPLNTRHQMAHYSLDDSLSQTPPGALSDALQQLRIDTQKAPVDNLVQPQADRIDRSALARMSAGDRQGRDRSRSRRRNARIGLSIGSWNVAVDSLYLTRRRGSGGLPGNEAEPSQPSQRSGQALAPRMTPCADTPLGQLGSGLFVLPISRVERTQTVGGGRGSRRRSRTSGPGPD